MRGGFGNNSGNLANGANGVTGGNCVDGANQMQGLAGGRGMHQAINGGYFGWEHLVVPIIVTAAVVVVIFLLIKFYKDRGKNEAMQVLNIKFANGQISEEEYINKKKILNQKVKKSNKVEATPVQTVPEDTIPEDKE